MEFEEEGFQFRPENSELLTYLLRFISEKDLHDDGFITECDVYKQEPWLTYSRGRHCGRGDDGDTSIFRYFISPRHKKKKTNDRFCRVVGKNLGTWKQQDKGKMVVSKHNKSLSMGLKKSLYYDTNMCCPDDGKWLMKEYVFCDAILRKFENSNFKDYCICAIKTKPEKNSASCSRSSNVSTTVMDFSDEQKVDTKVISGVNSAVPRMDQECKEVTPINIVEPMLKIQEASSGEEKIKELLENDDPEIMLMRNEDYGMINHPINVVENPAMEAAGEWNGVLEFENTMPENNLPKEPAHLQQDCPFGVSEDRIASFVGLLSGCGNSAIRNNQEAPGEENGQLELNTFSQIQQPMIPDFANVKSTITMLERYDTLAEYMGVDVLMNPNNELLIHPFDISKRAIVESNQEAAGEENGLLGQTVSPFSKVQEFVMAENNVPEMFDTGDTLLEINQTPQEESETLCETEESSFVAALTEALLDYEPLKDISDAIRSTLLLDQQSWQSKAHLQDMLL
ncbi:uncharacterized protein LOC125825028 [Solanum verrucosum]|uniref:uncharacterized protein LOC125825028 n=1 Tax=Solanum verrucosum TaxID=315347 RepID=UPI0020D11AED|nr:uncharacterized protein LOC125825028 [Solanum verrucosum]